VSDSSIAPTDYKVVSLKIRNIEAIPYSYASISVGYYNDVESILEGCHIYLVGKGPGPLGKDSSYTAEIPDLPTSMRTSVRHIDILGNIVVVDACVSPMLLQTSSASG